MVEMKPIAYIKSDFKEKFGIPRQSNLVPELISYVVFEPEYCNADAFRGLSDYSYIWLIWEFSKSVRKSWSPTVRPPRLGGNTRVGVFATRSPFRPNPIGLSSVKLDEIIFGDDGTVTLKVSGADLLDGTPIYDVKPYVPYSDSHPEARGGFATAHHEDKIAVVLSEEVGAGIPNDMIQTLKKILALDPRPSYHEDDNRTYGMSFAGYDVKFQVKDDVLMVIEIVNET